MPRTPTSTRVVLTWTVVIGALLVALFPLASPAGAQGYRCGGQRATMVGTSGADVLKGTAGRDVIVGLGGADVIRGFGGNDIICAGSGADTVYGGKGRDRIYGGSGEDRLLGQGGRDKIWGGKGADFIYGGSSGDTLRGGKGPDSIEGQKGNDKGFGQGGRDVCLTEQRNSCGVDTRDPRVVMRAFITAAIADEPVIQYFAPMIAGGLAPPDYIVGIYEPGPDYRKDAKAVRKHFSRFDSSHAIVLNPLSGDCDQWNGGDLSYTCTIRVRQDGVGQTEITLVLTWGQRIQGWSFTQVVRRCGVVDQYYVITDGAPVSCRRAMHIADRYYNDPTIEKAGSGAYANVEDWGCSSPSGTVYTYSGVGSTCGANSGGAELVTCALNFEPQLGIDPDLYHDDASLCALFR